MKRPPKASKENKIAFAKLVEQCKEDLEKARKNLSEKMKNAKLVTKPRIGMKVIDEDGNIGEIVSLNIPKKACSQSKIVSRGLSKRTHPVDMHNIVVKMKSPENLPDTIGFHCLVKSCKRYYSPLREIT